MRRVVAVLLALALPAGAEEIPVELPASEAVPEAAAVALPPDAGPDPELLDLVFYGVANAEELRLLLRRARVASAIRSDTVLSRVLHARFVHPWVAERTGKSIEELERLHREILRNPARVPRGARLAEIPLFVIPRLDLTARETGTASRPHRGTVPVPAVPVAPPAPPPGRWTRWGWVEGR